MNDSLNCLALKHASTAVLSMPVNISAEANALSFGVEFRSAHPAKCWSSHQRHSHTELDQRQGIERGIQLLSWMNLNLSPANRQR
jgi:hypothetical protein